MLVNLVLLCDLHHDVVHKPGWRATFDGNSFTVINPDGRGGGEHRQEVSGASAAVR